MKKRLFISFLILLIALLFLSGCKKENTSPPLNSTPEIRYLISMKINKFESKGEFFYDEEKRLHLLHTDPTSPLFGMEEIFENKSIKTNFKDLTYERDFCISGTAIIKNIFDIIQKESGKQITENKERKQKFSGENYDFVLYHTKNNINEKKIEGTVGECAFKITFIPTA